MRAEPDHIVPSQYRSVRVLLLLHATRVGLRPRMDPGQDTLQSSAAWSYLGYTRLDSGCPKSRDVAGQTATSGESPVLTVPDPHCLAVPVPRQGVDRVD